MQEREKGRKGEREKGRKGERESNIELLRIVLMFMIIIHHLIMHGTTMTEVAFYKMKITQSYEIRVIINSFLICAVNCFIFISGYYGIKFKIENLIKLLMQILFYSVTISCIYFVIEPDKINLKYISIMCLPLQAWWFLSAYISLYLVSPFLNKLIKNINKKEYHILIMILGIGVMFIGFTDSFPYIISVSRGYSLVSFIFVYILGRYVYLNKVKFNLKLSILGYIASTVIIATSVIFIWHWKSSIGAWKMFSYNDIFVIAAAIFIFFIFKNIKIKSKLINWSSTSVLGIYMIHDHYFIRESIYKSIFKIKDYVDSLIFIPVLILMATIIFVICMFLDKIREIIVRPIENYVLRLEKIRKLSKILNFEEKNNLSEIEGVKNEKDRIPLQ